MDNEAVLSAYPEMEHHNIQYKHQLLEKAPKKRSYPSFNATPLPN
jgi:hypothetical protein